MENFNAVLQKHIGAMRNYVDTNRRVFLPMFDERVVQNLAESAKVLFSKETTILDVNVPTFIIGDLRGSIFHLYKIFSVHNFPPSSRYLFLGNFIGDSEFSLECVTLIFALKVIFPRHIFVLRGENEFPDSPHFSCFRKEVRGWYSTDVLASFVDVLSALPLGASVFGQILAVNGGVTLNLDELRHSEKSELTWQNPDVRKLIGVDTTGSDDAQITQFCNEHDFSLVIKSHVCVENGFLASEDGHACTIYSGIHNINKYSSLMSVNSLDDISAIRLDIFRSAKRKDVDFVKPDEIEVQNVPQTLPPLVLATSRQRTNSIFINTEPVISLAHPIHAVMRSFERIKNITRHNPASGMVATTTRNDPSRIGSVVRRAFPKRYSLTTKH